MSGSGTFRTWPELRDESVVRTKADSATTTDLWVHGLGRRRRACEVICPTGKSAGIMSSPFRKNISLRRLLETPLVIPAVPPHKSNCAEVDAGPRAIKFAGSGRCVAGGIPFLATSDHDVENAD